MRISHITWAAMTGITLSLVLLGGGLLWTEGATWLARTRGERLTEAFGTALRVADLLIAERASTKEVLSGAAPEESRATMTVARAATDAIVNRLDNELDAAGLGNPDFKTSLIKGHSLLTRVRLTVDDALAGQIADRLKLSGEYYSAMSDVLAAVRPVEVPIQMALLEVAGPAVAFHQLARLAVDARISAGSRSGRLGDAMLAGRPPTPEETVFMDRMAGRVDGLADEIQTSALQLGSPPPIAAAIEAMKAGYLTAGRQIFDRQLASVRNHEPYPTSAETFFADISLPQRSIQLVRDAALDEARRRTRIDREHAETGLAMACLLVMTGTACAFAFCLLLRRRVIKPIGQLTATMERLADPDWAAMAVDEAAGIQAAAFPGPVIPASARQDEVGSMARAVAVFRDGLLRAERATRRQRDTQHFLDAVLEHVPAPIFVKQASDLTYRHVNRAAERFAGLSRDRLIGRTAGAVMHRDTLAIEQTCDLAALASTDTTVDHDVRLSTPHNGERLADVTRVPIWGPDSAPKYLLIMVNDLTERRKAEQRIAYMAHYDTLTDLPNRVTFAERLSEAVSDARLNRTSIAVFSLDIDHFAEINDVLGDEAGDALLRAIALRLGQCVREGDVVARVGGDEFAVILRNLRERQEAEALASHLLKAIARPFDIDDHPVFVGVSVGIAVSEPGVVGSELVKRADLALYEAKESGRGGLRWFVPHMDVRLHTRRTLEHELRLAIGTPQLRLVYQPQVDLDRGTIIGAEALMRWDNPHQGSIAPTTFIPLAEDTGLIGPLGEWLLAEACAEAIRWPAHMTIAVNVSPTQLRMPGFIDTVRHALDTSGLKPGRLELEVTEGVLLRDAETTLSKFAGLRELGVRLALDDFGTGYSSLNYLQRFRFDKIKIDRSFVTGLSGRPDAAAIVRAVLGLSKALGMQAVAEGTETASEVAALRALGCRSAQGFHFWRPMDALAMQDLVWPLGPAKAERAAR